MSEGIKEITVTYTIKIVSYIYTLLEAFVSQLNDFERKYF
jgi:hypothetical protein